MLNLIISKIAIILGSYKPIISTGDGWQRNQSTLMYCSEEAIPCKIKKEDENAEINEDIFQNV